MRGFRSQMLGWILLSFIVLLFTSEMAAFVLIMLAIGIGLIWSVAKAIHQARRSK